VKPANILIAPPAIPGAREHCYLTDFGLAHDAAAPAHLTRSGTFVGTIDYVAPEQIDGAAPEGRADQYALACVLFECLTGHPPFPRDQEVVVMWAHLQDEPPAVTADRPDLPGAVDAVLTRALAKAPADRFPSCRAMVQTARAAATGREPVTQRVAPAPAKTPARPTRTAAAPWPSGRRFRRALARAA
jgi:serine/threonine-protein kinase